MKVQQGTSGRTIFAEETGDAPRRQKRRIGSRRFQKNSIFAIPIVSLAVLLVVGCGGTEQPVIGAGELTMTLTATSPTGVVYRLRDAVFLVRGPADQDASSEDYLPGQPWITFDLPAGAYQVTLQDGWRMERSANAGPFTDIPATLVSPNPLPGTVIANQITELVFQFQVDSALIDFGRGTLSIGIQVEEVNICAEGGQGGCVECTSAAQCDDANVCTNDFCGAAGACGYLPADGVACDFGGSTGICSAGVCRDAMLCTDGATGCDDSNPCTVDSCNPITGDCANDPTNEGGNCDFGGSPGVCTNGVCEDAMLCADAATRCDDSNDCTTDTCDDLTGNCSHSAVGDGATCDLGGSSGTCTAGTCEPLPPDLLVCGGGGCFRHDSETGTQVDAFTLYDSVTHCGDTGLFPPLFDNDGILWLASKDANNSVGNRFCRYDNTGTLILPTFTLPAAAWQGPGFIVNDWTVTHTGKIFAAVRDANINPRYVWQVVVGSAAAPPQNSLACGGNFPPNALVAAPADPADPLRETGYAVHVANGVAQLVEFDFSFSPPSCAMVALVGDNDPATDNMSQTVAPQVSRIRLAPDGSIYLLAAHGNVYAGTDEGIWRITPARDIEQSLAMCDLLPQPCSSTTSEKPIIDFAVHPTNGNLYVLARDDAPFQLKLEVYDPQGNSLGVLYRWTDVRYSLEFFPTN